VPFLGWFLMCTSLESAPFFQICSIPIYRLGLTDFPPPPLTLSNSTDSAFYSSLTELNIGQKDQTKTSYPLSILVTISAHLFFSWLQKVMLSESNRRNRYGSRTSFS
jgi:hypothetical protein